MLKTSPEAIQLAKESLHLANPSVISNVASTSKPNVTSTAVNSADDVARSATLLGKTANVASKAAVLVAVAVEVGTQGYASYKTEQDYANGKIDDRQRATNHAGNVGGCIAGTAGAYGGATGGAMAGAAVGIAICPVIGTAVGGAVGAIGGGIGGYMAGDYVGSEVGKAATGWFW
jgi:hypothetical protein